MGSVNVLFVSATAVMGLASVSRVDLNASSSMISPSEGSAISGDACFEDYHLSETNLCREMRLATS
jgi:hypothetical protein